MATYSDFWLIKNSELSKLKKFFKEDITKPQNDWVFIFTEDYDKVLDHVDIALHFDTAEYRSWSFEFYHRSVYVCGGAFGESPQDEIYKEDNFLSGEIDKMARLLKIDEETLKKTFITDPQSFAQLLNFEILAGTPSTYSR